MKYLKLEVTRTETTEVYVVVPDDVMTNLPPPARILGKIATRAAVNTTRDYDWDKMGWEHGIELQSVSEVNSKEATQYTVYEPTADELAPLRAYVSSAPDRPPA